MYETVDSDIIENEYHVPRNKGEVSKPAVEQKLAILNVKDEMPCFFIVENTKTCPCMRILVKQPTSLV